MEREVEVTVAIGNRSYVVHGFYESDSRELGIDSIIGDVLDYLPSDRFNEIADRAEELAERQEQERRQQGAELWEDR